MISEKVRIGMFPSHLKNWTDEHKMNGMLYLEVMKKFNETTNGRIIGMRDKPEFILEFDKEEDYIIYLLKYL